MILRLEDNGPTGARTIYNAKTGIAYIIEPNTPMAGKNRKAIKKVKKEAKKAKKIAKVQGKAQRAVNKQTAKTKRQSTVQLKKQTRKDVGVEKQNKRMIRVKGRQNIIKTRQQSKMDKFAPEDTYSSTFEPEQVDSLPNETYDNTPGADYMVDSEMYYPDPEYVDTDYEEVTDDEQLEDGLSFGFIPGLIKGAANLITKATESKAGQAVGKVAADAKELQRLRVENAALKGQQSSLLTQRWIFAAGGTATGLAVGYFIGKKK